MRRMIGIVFATVTVVLTSCATTPEVPERAWVWMFERPPTAEGCDFTVGPYDNTDEHYAALGREVLPPIRDRSARRQHSYRVSGGAPTRPAPGQPQCLTVTRIIGHSAGQRTATIGFILTAIDADTVEIRAHTVTVSTSALWKRTYSPIGVTVALEAAPSIPDAATVRADLDLGATALGVAETVGGTLRTPWPEGASLRISTTVTETR